MYKKIKLKNNARLILTPQKNTATSTLLVLFRVGSRYEKSDQAGISHFIEHLMFKGTKKRPTKIAIAKELDGVGAAFNAFTSKDYTGYYVKTDKSHLKMATDVLSDILLNSKFESSEIEKEKGVIIEEINMYEDNPLMYVDDLLEQAMFPHPLGQVILGHKQTVKNITRQNIVDYYTRLYKAGNMVIVLSGNFSEDNVSEIKKKFRFKVSTKKNKFKAIKIDQKEPRVNLHFRETEQVQLAFGLPAYGYGDPGIYALQILSIILGGNMSSRLFLEVREKQGLAYFINSGLSVYEDTGALVIQAGLDKDRIKKAVSLIVAELKKIREGVTQAEIDRAKEYLVGKLALDLEDTANLAQWYGKQEVLTDKILTPKEKLDKLRAVTKKQIKQTAKAVINLKRINLIIIGPFENEALFKKILK